MSELAIKEQELSVDEVFRKFIEEHYSQLFSFTKHKMKSIGSDSFFDAEDVLQNALILIYKKITEDSSFLDIAKLKSFSYVLLKHQIYHSLNKEKYQHETHSDEDIDKMYHDESFSEKLESTEETYNNLQLLNIVIKTLSEEERNILGLYALGFSNKEISESLAVSESVVKVRKIRALSRLKKMYKKIRT